MIGPAGAFWAFRRLDTAEVDAQRQGIQLYSSGLAPRRQRDYLAGRLAAAEALRRAGSTTVMVGRDARGAPVWPDAWCGSIAHDGMAVAVAASRRLLVSIGCDLQSDFDDQETITAVRLHVGASRELALASPQLFAIKEAAYKCMSQAGLEFRLRDFHVCREADAYRVRCAGYRLHTEFVRLASGQHLAVVWWPVAS